MILYIAYRRKSARKHLGKKFEKQVFIFQTYFPENQEIELSNPLREVSVALFQFEVV